MFTLKPLIPFEPIRTDLAPSGGQWIGQVKWDGVRVLTYYDGREVRLFNRKLHERTMQYPELLPIDQYCAADSAILDGEIIALVEGKPSFHEVMKRDGVRKSQNLSAAQRQVSIHYMIFDILYCNQAWVVDRPLEERQHLLEQMIQPNSLVQIVQSFPTSVKLFEAVKEQDMEGVVYKDLTSKYLIDGKDKRWLKKKNIHDLVAVVGGVTLRGGKVNAVLLGLYDDLGQLWYIGHAGTGRFTGKDWQHLTDQLPNLRQARRPFVNLPERMSTAIWTVPRITLKINYLEWTISRTLRQPSIQAITDTKPEDCTFEQT